MGRRGGGVNRPRGPTRGGAAGAGGFRRRGRGGGGGGAPKRRRMDDLEEKHLIDTYDVLDGRAKKFQDEDTDKQVEVCSAFSKEFLVFERRSASPVDY